MKKCTPGVICIENITILFILLLIFISFYIFNKYLSQTSEKVIIKEDKRENIYGWSNIPYSNLPMQRDVLLNPYVPPLSNDRFIIPTQQGIMPINISTNVGAVDTTYRQMGILTPVNERGNNDKIIPLMGRPLYTNRDKWQYYTISDQRNSIKLPIVYNGKSCTNEYGCNRLFSGDVVYIEGINQPYKITIYDNDTIRYLPSI